MVFAALAGVAVQGADEGCLLTGKQLRLSVYLNARQRQGGGGRKEVRVSNGARRSN